MIETQFLGTLTVSVTVRGEWGLGSGVGTCIRNDVTTGIKMYYTTCGIPWYSPLYIGYYKVPLKERNKYFTVYKLR